MWFQLKSCKVIDYEFSTQMEETMLAMMVSILPVQQPDDDDNSSQMLRPNGKRTKMTLDSAESNGSQLELDTERE